MNGKRRKEERKLRYVKLTRENQRVENTVTEDVILWKKQIKRLKIKRTAVVEK